MSPAVPSDAVPASAGITTETIDRIVGARIRTWTGARTGAADSALKLSDRTLTVGPVRAVGFRLFPQERAARPGRSRAAALHVRLQPHHLHRQEGETAMSQEPRQAAATESGTITYPPEWTTL